MLSPRLDGTSARSRVRLSIGDALVLVAVASLALYYLRTDRSVAFSERSGWSPIRATSRVAGDDPGVDAFLALPVRCRRY